MSFLVRMFAVVVALTASLSVLTAAPGAAQGDERAPAVTLSASFIVDDPVTVDVVVPDGVDQLSVTVHDTVVRTQLLRSFLVGPSAPQVVNRTVAVQPDAAGRARFSIADRRTLPEGQTADIVATLRDGVHPLTVTFGDDGESVSAYLAVLGPSDPEATPLSIAVVAPFDVAPALAPDGTVSVADEDRAALARLADVVEATAGVSLNVALPPELIDALGAGDDPDDAALLARLRAGLADRTVLSAPYVAVDEQALAEADAGDVIAELYERGDGALTDALGVEPVRGVAVLDPTASGAAISELDRLGFDSVVVEEELLEPVDPTDFPITLTQTFRMSGTGITTVQATSTSPLLDVSAADPVAAVDHTLADLHLLYLDRPGPARGVVLTLPDLNNLDIGSTVGILEGIASSPVLDAVALPSFFDRVEPSLRPDDSPLIRPHTARRTDPVDGYVADRSAVRDLVDSYTRFVADESIVAVVGDLLEVSAAAILDPTERDAYLDVIYARIQDDFGRVELEERSELSLTSDTASITVRVTSDLAYTSEARLTFTSDDRISVNGGDPLDIRLPPGLTEIEVPVRALTNGRTPFDVALETPDGAVELSRTEMSIRATGLSGVGIVIAVVAIVVLALWWIRQRGANRHPQPTDTTVDATLSRGDR